MWMAHVILFPFLTNYFSFAEKTIVAFIQQSIKISKMAYRGEDVFPAVLDVGIKLWSSLERAEFELSFQFDLLNLVSLDDNDVTRLRDKNIFAITNSLIFTACAKCGLI